MVYDAQNQLRSLPLFASDDGKSILAKNDKMYILNDSDCFVLKVLTLKSSRNSGNHDWSNNRIQAREAYFEELYYWCRKLCHKMSDFHLIAGVIKEKRRFPATVQTPQPSQVL